MVLDRAQVEEAMGAMDTLRRIFGAPLSSSSSSDAAPDTAAGAACTLGESIDVFQVETDRMRAAAHGLFAKCTAVWKRQHLVHVATSSHPLHDVNDVLVVVHVELRHARGLLLPSPSAGVHGMLRPQLPRHRRRRSIPQFAF